VFALKAAVDKDIAKLLATGILELLKTRAN